MWKKRFDSAFPIMNTLQKSSIAAAEMTCFSRDNPSVMQKTARLLTEADYKSQKEQCSLQRRFKESSRGGEGEDLSERLGTREREKEEAGRKKAAEVKSEKWKRAR